MNQLNHIFVIPDGNRRWADMRNMSYSILYKYIAENVTTNLVEHVLINKKIPELTIFGLSRKNVLDRDQKQVESICDAQITAYDKWANNGIFENAEIRFRFIGDRSILPNNYKQKIQELEEKTKNAKKSKCNILVAYDSMWEISNAIRRIQKEKKTVDEKTLWDYLDLQSEIDLVIRTGFEKRLSGGPMLQSQQAEVFFEDYYYPELTPERMDRIIEDYQKRERRFGK